MTTWFSKDLGDGQAALAPSKDILAAYLAHALAHGEDTGAAVFSRMDLATGMVTAYFTPEAAELARRFGAESCPKPERVGRLTLLAGSQIDWGKHFPD